jgi:hypothetical protein
LREGRICLAAFIFTDIKEVQTRRIDVSNRNVWHMTIKYEFVVYPVIRRKHNVVFNYIPTLFVFLDKFRADIFTKADVA